MKIRYWSVVAWTSGLLLILSSCHPSKLFLANVDDQYYQFEPETTLVDTFIVNMIEPYKIQLDGQMNEVITNAKGEFVKARPNGTLNNLVADAVLEEAKLISELPVDFAIQNYGGIRIPAVSEGDVTIGKVYEIMPFENILVILELDGAKTKMLLDRIAVYGGWPISNTLSFTIGSDSLATDIMVGDNAFDQKKTYYVAMPDYIANGGDDCDFLLNAPRTDTGTLIRDLLIQNFRRKVNLNPDFKKRIKS